MSAIDYQVTAPIARITLDRPERGNGINSSLVTELEHAVEQADLDPAVHVLLLAGNGKGFCGGYDLVESAEGQGRLEGGRPEGDEDGPAARPPAGSPLDPSVMAANHAPGTLNRFNRRQTNSALTAWSKIFTQW